MSDDYYDEIWTDIWTDVIDVQINVVSREELQRISNAAKAALESKLTKLNVLLKNLDVYCHGDLLLVNDRYGICKEFASTAEVFGFSVELVDSGLKGKSYVLKDSLIDFIKATDPSFSIKNFANKSLNEKLQVFLGNYAQKQVVSDELKEILLTIIQTGHYSVKGEQQVVSTYVNGKKTEETRGETISDEGRISSLLYSFTDAVYKKLKSTNADLQNGTVRLLYNRARQMGYAVKEERKGAQVQLVLVRAE